MIDTGWWRSVARSVRSLTAELVLLVYLAIGGVWLVVSRRVVGSVIDVPGVSHVHFWLELTFICLSGAIIFGLLKAHQAAISTKESRLNRLSQQLQVFNRVLRHNIRNELTVILGRVESAEENGPDFDEDLQRDLENIERSAERIHEVAEKARKVDHVDISYDSNPAEIGPLVRAVVDEFRSAYPDVTFRTELPGSGRVPSRTAVTLILNELVENAVVHNDRPPAEREVDVVVRTSLTSTVTIEVRDNGPGIDEAEVEPIVTGEETPLDHASSIGLWIAHWAVAHQDGELAISSTDSGTTVRIELPSMLFSSS